MNCPSTNCLCSRRLITPTSANRTKMIGMTDQKLRARKVESPFAPRNPIIVRPALCSSRSVPRSLDIDTLEGVFDADGPDDVGPQAVVAVERKLDDAIEEKGLENVHLRPKAK